MKDKAPNPVVASTTISVIGNGDFLYILLKWPKDLTLDDVVSILEWPEHHK